MFRSNLWNETIPDSVRGRLAGIEMMSYMSGPLIGNTWMGFLAASVGTHQAMQIGGVASTVIIALVVALAVPALWRFRSVLTPVTAPAGGALKEKRAASAAESDVGGPFSDDL
jgi:hypothetical protein